MAKQLISLEALEQQAIMKHCLNLMPFAQPKRALANKLLCETGELGCMRKAFRRSKSNGWQLIRSARGSY